ncbi:hypothetical protein L3081_24945 [Colwellia sp. MSW7]|uniref:Uncharacterized protein n=1 Tax=Colwellia maritima TaxID=2912588 RepID=A0ABS9X754_9GAMM|nr:hypothetical protein [Colwellia maritima]MCI2286073.1 hypothetical protein [Colwellia maritima]
MNNFNEICPKCQGEMMPFDITCDDCYEFTVEVFPHSERKVKDILTVLSVKFKAFTEKGDDSKWSLDRMLLLIEVPRKDEETIRQLLIEELSTC